ncbi:MAG: hypothetical protein ACNI27_15180 [Desulfovibrio sp.]
MIKSLLALSTFVAYYSHSILGISAGTSIPVHMAAIMGLAFYLLKDKGIQLTLSLALISSWLVSPYYSQVHLISIAHFAPYFIAPVIWFAFSTQHSKDLRNNGIVLQSAFYCSLIILALLQTGVCSYILNVHLTYMHSTTQPMTLAGLCILLAGISSYQLYKLPKNQPKQDKAQPFWPELAYLYALSALIPILNTLAAIGTFYFYVTLPLLLIFCCSFILNKLKSNRCFYGCFLASGTILFFAYGHAIYASGSTSILFIPYLACLGVTLSMFQSSITN